MTLQASLFAYGDRIDYTNPSSTAIVPAGTVVFQNDLFGAAAIDIPASRKGALATRGLMLVPKDASTFFAGQRVYWDLVNLVATSDPTKGPIMGAAVLAQLTGDATVYVLVDSLHTADTYYVEQAAGAALTNSANETTLASCNFPANRLQVGDVIRVFFQGIATAVTADTLQIKGYLGGVNFFTSAAQAPTANDIFEVEAQIVVRALGGPATGLIVAAGTQNWGTPGTSTQKAWSLPATNLDTTVAELLKFTGKYSAAAAGDSCRADILNVELLRQQ